MIQYTIWFLQRLVKRGMETWDWRSHHDDPLKFDQVILKITSTVHLLVSSWKLRGVMCHQPFPWPLDPLATLRTPIIQILLIPGPSPLCLLYGYPCEHQNSWVNGVHPPKQGLNKVFNEDITIFIHLKNAWWIEGWLHITPFAYAPKIMPKLSYWMGYANFEKCPGTCRDVYVALYFCDVLRHLLYFIPKFESCSGSILFLSDAMFNHPLLNSRYYWLSHYSCWVYM